MDSLSSQSIHRKFLDSLPSDKKYCPGCNLVLDRFTDFNANKAQPDKRAPHCRKCRSAMSKIVRSTEEHKQKEHDRYKKKYQENPEPFLVRGRDWTNKNRDKHSALNLRNHEVHKDRYRAKNREWKLANPEIVNVAHSNRRAREKQNGGKFTLREWNSLKASYGYTCLCCRHKEPEIKLTADHILPLSRGGANSIDNIQPLCRSCNNRKYTKHIDYRGGWEL